MDGRGPVDGLSVKSMECFNSENNIARTQHAPVANFIQRLRIPELYLLIFVKQTIGLRTS